MANNLTPNHQSFESLERFLFEPIIHEKLKTPEEESEDTVEAIWRTLRDQMPEKKRKRA